MVGDWPEKQRVVSSNPGADKTCPQLNCSYGFGFCFIPHPLTVRKKLNELENSTKYSLFMMLLTVVIVCGNSVVDSIHYPIDHACYNLFKQTLSVHVWFVGTVAKPLLYLLVQPSACLLICLHTYTRLSVPLSGLFVSALCR